MTRIEQLLEAPVIGPQDGPAVQWAGFGARMILSGEQTGGGFSLVEHPIGPRALASPMHTHVNEDEYSYVLEGVVGFQLGDRVVEGRPGDLVCKPRGVPHAFWNAGDEPARVLELISAPGFENYFFELAEAIPADGPRDLELIARICAKYELDMDMESVPGLCERHGVRFGRMEEAPPAG